jgi:Fe-S-cluster containining protein
MRLPDGDSELLQQMDAAFADAAQRSGPRLLCRPGCTQCCHGAFAINALDALRLKTGMEELRQRKPDQAAEIEQRARQWIAAYGADFPGDAQTGRLGETEAEQESFEEFANEAACPALNPTTGCCDLYAWRPMTCRLFGPPVRIETGEAGDCAFGHCELCFSDAETDEVAACEMKVPHDLEERLLEEVEPDGDSQGETVIAFALLR